MTSDLIDKMPVPQPEIAMNPAILKGWPYNSSMDIKTTTKLPPASGKVAPYMLPAHDLLHATSDSDSFLSASPSPIEVPEMMAKERLVIPSESLDAAEEQQQQQQEEQEQPTPIHSFLSSPVACDIGDLQLPQSVDSFAFSPSPVTITSASSSAWETTSMPAVAVPQQQQQQQQQQRRNSRVRRAPQRALESVNENEHAGFAFSFAAPGCTESGCLNVLSRQYDLAQQQQQQQQQQCRAAAKAKRKGTMLFPEAALVDSSSMDISALLDRPLSNSRPRERPAALKRARHDFHNIRSSAALESDAEHENEFAGLSSLATAFIPADIPRRSSESSTASMSVPSSPRSQMSGAAGLRTPVARKNKQCACCGVTSTPLWRDIGKELPLCNACGIRWKKYGIVCDNCQYVPCKQERESKICMRCNSRLAPASRRARIPSACASPSPAPSTPTPTVKKSAAPVAIAAPAAASVAVSLDMSPLAVSPVAVASTAADL